MEGPAGMGPRNDPEYVAYLEQRIAALEARVPQTQLLSPKFLTRAFAVVGHYLVASLVIVLPIYAVMFVLFIVLGMAGYMSFGM